MNEIEKLLRERCVLSVCYLMRKFKFTANEARERMQELLYMAYRLEKNKNGNLERIYFIDNVKSLKK